MTGRHPPTKSLVAISGLKPIACVRNSTWLRGFILPTSRLGACPPNKFEGKAKDPD